MGAWISYIGFFFFVVVSVTAHASPTDIALVQYDADRHFGDYAHNMSELVRYAEEAVSKDSKIIVLPEGSAYGYEGENSYWCSKKRWMDGCKDVAQIAEAIPSGKTTRTWEAFAKQRKVYVVFNLPESSGKKFYNTTAVVGPNGYVTKYRKRSLYETDTYYATEGDLGPVIVDTPLGKFGLLICMDLNYSSYYTEYKKLGVSQILSNMDWAEDPQGPRAARTFLQEIARENDVNIFNSDVSAWDGSGAYRHSERDRERNGLPTVGIGVDGISYHSAD